MVSKKLMAFSIAVVTVAAMSVTSFAHGHNNNYYNNNNAYGQTNCNHAGDACTTATCTYYNNSGTSNYNTGRGHCHR